MRDDALQPSVSKNARQRRDQTGRLPEAAEKPPTEPGGAWRSCFAEKPLAVRQLRGSRRKIPRNTVSMGPERLALDTMFRCFLPSRS
jgi:hypothetical protein